MVTVRLPPDPWGRPCYHPRTMASPFYNHLRMPGGSQSRRTGLTPPFDIAQFNRAMGYPTSNREVLVVSPYGPRRSGDHQAVDIRTNEGVEVIAPADGTVFRWGSTKMVPGQKGNCGWGVGLNHGQWSTTFCHMYDVTVKVGDVVKRGDVIGHAGGRPGHPGAGRSDGPHLHFNVVDTPDGTNVGGSDWKRNFVDPLAFIDWGEIAIGYSDAVGPGRRWEGYSREAEFARAEGADTGPGWKRVALVSAVGGTLLAAGIAVAQAFRRRG